MFSVLIPVNTEWKVNMKKKRLYNTLIVEINELRKEIAELKTLETHSEEEEYHGEYEYTSKEMAVKLMEFIRDMSDSEEEIQEEIKYITALFEDLRKSKKYNALIHHLDLMFMDDAFN